MNGTTLNTSNEAFLRGSRANNNKTYKNQQLKIFYQNVRGMRTKSKTVFRNTSLCDYDIVIFTETWLGPELFSHEFFPKKYDVFRYDRADNRGGGVLIAINSNALNGEVHSTNAGDVIEQVCVKISLGGESLYIYAYYIPPNSLVSTYEMHLDAINDLNVAMSMIWCLSLVMQIYQELTG